MHIWISDWTADFVGLHVQQPELKFGAWRSGGEPQTTVRREYAKRLFAEMKVELPVHPFRILFEIELTPKLVDTIGWE